MLKFKKIKYIFLLLTVTVTAGYANHVPFHVETKKKIVLLLNSYHRGYSWSDNINSGMYDTLKKKYGKKIDIYYEYMNSKENFKTPNDEYARKLKEILKYKYSKSRPDLVLINDSAAYKFYIAHWKNLFPGSRAVFCGVEKPVIKQIPGNMTGIISRTNYTGTIDLILKILPNTSKILFITDSTVTGLLNKEIIRRMESGYTDRVAFEIMNKNSDLYSYSIIQKASKLPKGNVIFFLDFYREPDQRLVDPEIFVKTLAEESSVPVFYHADTLMGLGIIGGDMVSAYEQGRTAALMGIRILSGEKISEIPVMAESPRICMLDENVLERFNVNRNLIPAGSKILFRQISFLEKNRFYIMGVFLFIIIESLAIIMLVVFYRKKNENETKYRGLFEYAGEGILYFNDEYIIDCNPKVEEIFGRTKNEIIGKTTADFSPEFQPDGKRSMDKICEMKTGLAQGKKYSMEWLHIKPDGKTFRCDVTLNPIALSGARAAQAIIRDIEDRKKMEEQLNQSRKMDVVGQLAGGIAHDFNNMMAGIMGNTELIEMKLPKDSPLLKYTKTIASSIERASELTKRLLFFSRKNTMNLETVNIHSIIDETVSLLERSLNKNIEIKIFNEAEYPLITGDSTLLQNSLLNLSINARDAMNDGGTLTIRTRNITIREEDHAKYTEQLEPGTYIEISVCDTGTGIDKDIIKKIFDPFFTTKDVGKGTGLGLSAVYGTVKEHSGHITVYSETSIGTVFRLYFPSVLGKDNSSPMEFESSIYRGTGRILIADDEAIILDAAKNQLQSLGYDVHCTGNGQEALEYFISNKDNIDLVILDVIMPVMSGKDTLKNILEISPEAKVLISSGFTTNIWHEEIINLGAAGFIQKPYRLNMLSYIIAKTLGKISPTDPEF